MREGGREGGRGGREGGREQRSREGPYNNKGGEGGGRRYTGKKECDRMEICGVSPFISGMGDPLLDLQGEPSSDRDLEKE